MAVKTLYNDNIVSEIEKGEKITNSVLVFCGTAPSSLVEQEYIYIEKRCSFIGCLLQVTWKEAIIVVEKAEKEICKDMWIVRLESRVIWVVK